MTDPYPIKELFDVAILFISLMTLGLGIIVIIKLLNA
jgi:hypothetical protein